MSEQAPTKEQVPEIIWRLASATIASCECLTKTPDPQHHTMDCRYRIMQEAILEIERLQRELDAMTAAYDTVNASASEWMDKYIMASENSNG